MRDKLLIIIFGLSTAILLNGCTLNVEPNQKNINNNSRINSFTGSINVSKSSIPSIKNDSYTGTNINNEDELFPDQLTIFSKKGFKFNVPNNCKTSSDFDGKEIDISGEIENNIGIICGNEFSGINIYFSENSKSSLSGEYKQIGKYKWLFKKDILDSDRFNYQYIISGENQYTFTFDTYETNNTQSIINNLLKSFQTNIIINEVLLNKYYILNIINNNLYNKKIGFPKEIGDGEYGPYYSFSGNNNEIIKEIFIESKGNFDTKIITKINSQFGKFNRFILYDGDNDLLGFECIKNGKYLQYIFQNDKLILQGEYSQIMFNNNRLIVNQELLASGIYEIMLNIKNKNKLLDGDFKGFILNQNGKIIGLNKDGKIISNNN